MAIVKDIFLLIRRKMETVEVEANVEPKLPNEQTSKDFLFERNVKIIKRIHHKSFDKSLDVLLERILYEITQIDYQKEMVKFLEEGYQGMEIISHPKLCYLKDHLDKILEKIYEQLVKCNMVKRDTEENRNNFLGTIMDNPDLIFYVQCDVYGVNALTSLSLILTNPYLTTINGKNNVLIIHKKLPDGVHFLGQD